MATSGTAAFNPDIIDIIEEAYERVGIETRNGYQLTTAIRSLDLLTKEWANRGLNLWTIEETTSSITAGDTSAVLASDTIDILDANWRTGSGTAQHDRMMTRLSASQWSHIANKNQTGEPSQFWVNRTLTPTVYFWPVPVEAGTFVYWKLRRIEDMGTGANTTDVPPRFLPALVSGLAYYLAMKTPAAGAKLPDLQLEYERQFNLASQEDRERSSFRFVPDLSGY
jgi:hypothetical protein